MEECPNKPDAIRKASVSQEGRFSDKGTKHDSYCHHLREPLYNPRMPAVRALPLALVLTKLVVAQQTISFPTQDGGRICADLYGKGGRAIVLAHGGRFNKESWGDQARALVSAGFRVLAIDFRGVGCSNGPGQADFDTAPFENDVLAAVRYLKTHGVKTVSVVGGSFGGGAAGDASIKSMQGDIDRIVFLGAAPNLSAEKLKSRALFIVARDDANDAGPRLPGIREQYDKAPHPKELIILEGSAHAQFLFQTNQSDRVMREILRFLSMP
jgi:pimeloyl-ACP methyl ester carboxylesterase